MSHAHLRFYKSLKGLTFFHAAVYTCLLATWVFGLAEAKTVFGWAHGITWIVLTVLMLVALRMRVVPWFLVLLVGVIGPLIPFVGAIGFIHFKTPEEAPAT